MKKIKIVKGTWRIVVILPCLGLVLKFPRIYLLEVLKMSPSTFQHYLIVKIDHSSVFGPINMLLKGWADNFREFLFYWKTRHPFVEPTWFSFCGLVNVQRMSPDLGIDRWSFWRRICLAVGDGGYWQGYDILMADPHHYCEPCNFSRRDGRLLLRDYGSPKANKIVCEYGKKIYDSFKFE